MNLNFYSPNNANNLENLQAALQEQMEKLDQIKNIGFNQLKTNTQNTQNNVSQLQPQRYYLDCGIKEDWQQFLKINYNITEEQIFEDYRLFLQAKAEIYEDQNKEKLQSMKDKIIGPKNNSQQTLRHNGANQLPVNQQANIINEVNNGTNIANSNNANTNKNNKHQLENNTNNNENKGGKYVR